MSWWNAHYTNGCEEHTIQFGSNGREKVKAVEAVCQAVIDKKILGSEDVGVVVRCKNCQHSYKSSGSSTGYRCGRWGIYDEDCDTDPNGYCYKGERWDDRGKTD